MPNTASAKKRVRQSEKRNARNKVRKERLRKALKSFKGALEQKESAAALTEAVNLANSAVAKAGTKGILHKKTVARKRSRMAKAVAKVKSTIA